MCSSDLNSGNPVHGLPASDFHVFDNKKPQVVASFEEHAGLPAVKLVPTSVWRLLGRLGWSVQRPTGQARERDERAVRTWKAKRWPELKKSLRDKAE